MPEFIEFPKVEYRHLEIFVGKVRAEAGSCSSQMSVIDAEDERRKAELKRVYRRSDRAMDAIQSPPLCQLTHQATENCKWVLESQDWGDKSMGGGFWLLAEIAYSQPDCVDRDVRDFGDGAHELKGDLDNLRDLLDEKLSIHA